MEIVKDKISLDTLKLMAQALFGNMVKAVVDVQKEIMAVDSELHSDEEAELLKCGSSQKDLWGINLYPDLPENEWLEYDSMINLRPSQNNKTRGVDDPKLREKIAQIVQRLVTR